MKKINIFIPLILGIIVSLITKESMTYNNILKPALSPPSILFPIAWTVIYLLMGYSYYKYKKECDDDKSIDIIYYIQLIVNIIWSLIFFTLKNYLLASIWIIILDILVIALLLKYYKVYKQATYLNLIYMIWILFATYLTIAINILN